MGKTYMRRVLRYGLHSFGLRYFAVAYFCEYGSETWGSKKANIFLNIEVIPMLQTIIFLKGLINVLIP